MSDVSGRSVVEPRSWATSTAPAATSRSTPTSASASTTTSTSKAIRVPRRERTPTCAPRSRSALGLPVAATRASAGPTWCVLADPAGCWSRCSPGARVLRRPRVVPVPEGAGRVPRPCTRARSSCGRRTVVTGRPARAARWRRCYPGAAVARGGAGGRPARRGRPTAPRRPDCIGLRVRPGGDGARLGRPAPSPGTTPGAAWRWAADPVPAAAPGRRGRPSQASLVDSSAARRRHPDGLVGQERAGRPGRGHRVREGARRSSRATGCGGSTGRRRRAPDDLHVTATHADEDAHVGAARRRGQTTWARAQGVDRSAQQHGPRPCVRRPCWPSTSCGAATGSGFGCSATGGSASCRPRRDATSCGGCSTRSRWSSRAPPAVRTRSPPGRASAPARWRCCSRP